MATATLLGCGRGSHLEFLRTAAHAPTAYSVIPVVGDGRWIWTEPPTETGYLEPRDFELKVGIQLESTGNVEQLKATTPVPVEFPEQTIRHTQIQTDGCEAIIRPIHQSGSQLFVQAGKLGRHQTAAAAVIMRLTLRKQYHGYGADQFSASQPTLPKEFRTEFLSDSPGIQTRAPEVRALSARLSKNHHHPWEQARSFYNWVWENITARVGSYTSVPRALRDRVGDCEERAAVFVALCRAAAIPARLVWIPNHNWAEFYLVDEAGEGHWIPAHTAAYSWFGWTGAHELVIQKGDRLRVPEKRTPQRLQQDWVQWRGAKPKLRFLAELIPLPPEAGGDPGPGARRKNERGEWALIGDHALDYHLRDGAREGHATPRPAQSAG